MSNEKFWEVVLKLAEFKEEEIRSAMQLKGFTAAALAEHEDIQKSPQYISQVIKGTAIYLSEQLEQKIIELLQPELGKIKKINRKSA